jgi:choline dehydrogenase-like flavoprotein
MYKLFVRSEQQPNPASRLTLDDELDPLGVPRIRLDWQLSDLDLRTIRRAQELVALEVGRSGLGRVFLPPESGGENWADAIFGGSHHMGTTRMSKDPEDGVVDPDSRVHGLANLWVAGSSVFPSVGYANPTLTIVAMAFRLAERLSKELS